MTIRLDLCINSDPEFPYTQSSIYEVRMYGINAHTNAQKLKHIEIQFMLTQKTNYKIDEVQKTLALLDDYFSYKGSCDLGVCGAFKKFINENNLKTRTITSYGMGGVVKIFI